MDTYCRRRLIICILISTPFYLCIYERNDFTKGFSSVSFLGVGQGDSILIQSPSGKQLLIDAGRSADVVNTLEEAMPFFDRSIDVVIGTHPDADHIGGLPRVLDEYTIGAVFEPGSNSDSKIYASLEDSIIAKKIPHILARENMVIDFGDGAKFVFLFPYQDVSDWETNNSSIVGMYIYKDTSFLLTGDAPVATEMYLLKKYNNSLHADVLKLGHHGSRTSSSASFLKSLHPGLAILSSGKNNSYGHPHKEVLGNLQDLSIPYFNTADMGTITFETNGETIGLK